MWGASGFPGPALSARLVHPFSLGFGSQRGRAAEVEVQSWVLLDRLDLTKKESGLRLQTDTPALSYDRETEGTQHHGVLKGGTVALRQ